MQASQARCGKWFARYLSDLATRTLSEGDQIANLTQDVFNMTGFRELRSNFFEQYI